MQPFLDLETSFGRRTWTLLAPRERGRPGSMQAGRRTWTLLRHAERAPISAAFLTPSVGNLAEEAALWRSLLVCGDDASRCAVRYPVAHEDGFAWLTASGPANHPFGALTQSPLVAGVPVREADDGRVEAAVVP